MTPRASFRALTAKPEDDDRLWVAHFGGLFNPVHVGHVSIGRRLVDDYCFDRVVFVPGSGHYPKPDLAPETERLALLRLSTADGPRLV
jgi:nicotinic acid mononucleotide adenylyltransferase